MHKSTFVILLGLTLLFILTGCARISHPESSKAQPEKIRSLEAKVMKNPRDFSALRELGILSFEAERYKPAKNYLTRALKISIKDPKSLFYMGMTLEFLKEPTLALNIYAKYNIVPRLSPYRRLMEGRYTWLNQEKVRAEMSDLIANEAYLSEEKSDAEAIAVFPFKYLGSDNDYDVLGKGLSELIVVDLGKVPGLKLVERVRLQVLLDELSLSQSKVVDQITAPRAGKLLKAGRIVNGNYLVNAREQIRVDVASWEITQQSIPDVFDRSDVINNLIRLEKEIVFKLIAAYGIELTAEQRKRIEHIPTRNLQAFFAYSRGLELQDAGRYEAAALQFNQAVLLDPAFSEAARKQALNEGLEATSGPISQVAGKVAKGEKPGRKTLRSRLINNRLQTMAGSLNSNFRPGKDSRNPGGEAVSPTLGEETGLPDPPDPPPSPF